VFLSLTITAVISTPFHKREGQKEGKEEGRQGKVDLLK
jgi:hypothetical protein